MNMRALRIHAHGGAEVAATEVKASPERLRALMALALRIPVEACFPLERGTEAYELSRSGHARGKIVLQTA